MVIIPTNSRYKLPNNTNLNFNHVGEQRGINDDYDIYELGFNTNGADSVEQYLAELDRIGYSDWIDDSKNEMIVADYKGINMQLFGSYAEIEINEKLEPDKNPEARVFVPKD